MSPDFLTPSEATGERQQGRAQAQLGVQRSFFPSNSTARLLPCYAPSSLYIYVWAFLLYNIDSGKRAQC